MTQFNPINRNFLTSITITKESIYLFVTKTKGVNKRYLKNTKILVGKVIKHRYESSVLIVDVLEKWLDIVDLQDIFTKAMAYPPETIWECDGVVIDFSVSPEEVVDRIFGLDNFSTIFGNHIYRKIEDGLDQLL